METPCVKKTLITKDMYNGKAHQTSSPTILSTAVKAIRGAVVAAGVCVQQHSA